MATAVTMKRIRIVVVEDHALVRSGLRALLDSRDDAEVIGEAADGRTAVETVLTSEPDLVLMDISLPEMNGIEATRRILAERPEIRVLMLSMHSEDEYVYRSLRAGAAGYVLKAHDEEVLDEALETVTRGDVYLSPGISRSVVDRYMEGGTEELPMSPLELLTPRQREVLQMVAEGNTSREVAEKLEVSPRTVEAHRADIMDRLGIRDVTGLVRFAVRAGLITPRS